MQQRGLSIVATENQLTKINYSLLHEAIEYYSKQGYKLIEVPWIVDEKVAKITLPEGAKPYYTEGGVLVGSAEQGFLQMIINNLNSVPKKAMAITPCFRGESNTNDATRNYFMKLELIKAVSSTDIDLQSAVLDVVTSSLNFFRKYLGEEVTSFHTSEGRYTKDIMFRGLELGSYGFRSHDLKSLYLKGHISWVFGTGLAEPRLSIAREMLSNE